MRRGEENQRQGGKKSKATQEYTPLFRPQGWDLGLKAGIGASRLVFGLQGWDLGFKAGIWASQLEFGPQGWDFGIKTGI